MKSISITHIILILCFILSLIRGTQIGLFYPADERQLGDIDYSLIKYMNFVLLAGLLGYIFASNKYRVLIDAILKPPVFLFIGIGLASVIFSVDTVQSIKFMIAVTVISATVFFYIHAFGTDRFLRDTSLFILCLAVLSFVYVILMPQYGIMTGKHAGAWRGLFEHKNGSGPFFAIGFYFILYTFQNSKSSLRIPFLVGLGVCFLFVVMSKSSTSFLAFAVMGLSYASMSILYRFRNAAERLSVFLVFFSLLLISVFFAIEYMNEIIYALTGKDATLSGRTAIWVPLIEMSFDRPLLGYGLGMAQRPEFFEQIHHYLTFEAQSSHNSYLDVILGVGYPAAILLILMAVQVFFRNFLSEAVGLKDLKQKSFFTSLLLCLLILSFANSFILIGRSYFWAWFLAALICLSVSQSRGKVMPDDQ